MPCVLESITLPLSSLDSLFPTISQLSVAHSLLAKLSPHDQLTVCIGTTQPLLLWLFPVTCDIFDKYDYFVHAV